MEKYYLYLVLTRSNTIVSKMIHFAIKDEFTHAALSLDKDLTNMYSFGRKWTHYPFIGRFRSERINEGVYKLHKVLPGLVMEIEVSQEQYEMASKVIQHFISNSKLYKYNYRGLINGILNREVCYENRFLCSEFVYYVLHKSGIVDFHISRNLVKPQSLLQINGKIIFKGNLKEYNPTLL